MAKRAGSAKRPAATPERVLECSFLIPSRRDKEISDGKAHDSETWEWLFGQLYGLFSGYTLAPGWYKGVWKSPRTGKPVSDQSRKYCVAAPERQVQGLRQLLVEACGMFAQQFIYFSVAGVVEFVGVPDHGRTS